MLIGVYKLIRKAVYYDASSNRQAKLQVRGRCCGPVQQAVDG